MSLKEKEQKIIALEKENQALRERIAELERHLGIDSQTSSKPPSSDGLKKKNTHRTRKQYQPIFNISILFLKTD